MTQYFNEMYEGDAVRDPYAGLESWIRSMPAELRQMKQAEAEALFRRIGITFAVYGEGGDLVTAATAMEAAAGTDLASLQAAMGAVGGACGACHKAYRVPSN